MVYSSAFASAFHKIVIDEVISKVKRKWKNFSDSWDDKLYFSPGNKSCYNSDSDSDCDSVTGENEHHFLEMWAYESHELLVSITSCPSIVVFHQSDDLH